MTNSNSNLFNVGDNIIYLSWYDFSIQTGVVTAVTNAEYSIEVSLEDSEVLLFTSDGRLAHNESFPQLFHAHQKDELEKAIGTFKEKLVVKPKPYTFKVGDKIVYTNYLGEEYVGIVISTFTGSNLVEVYIYEMNYATTSCISYLRLFTE